MLATAMSSRSFTPFFPTNILLVAHALQVAGSGCRESRLYSGLDAAKDLVDKLGLARPDWGGE